MCVFHTGRSYIFVHASLCVVHRSIITFTTVGLGDYVAVCATSDSLWQDFFLSGEAYYLLFGLMITGDIVANSGEHFNRSAFYLAFCILPQTACEFVQTEFCCRHVLLV